MGYDAAAAIRFVDEAWEASVVPTLHDYIAIPAESPAFDADWATNGHLAAATELLRSWAASRSLADATVEVVQLPDLTPVILIDVPAHGDGITAPADDVV
ncbi:hypothetical protein I6F37_38805, partial [Bradyrhizobium sp. NBAIM08]